MPLRLYLSHASEDQRSVNHLRDQLKAKGFPVFLCEDLPPGSDWQKEIDLALTQTNVFIYCLSSSSVARPGKYEDELKAARARYRTEGDRAILIVPLRLDPCAFPPEVKDLMVLDLFIPDGFTRLLNLLETRAQAPARHVFLLHGIKTRGKWQKDVSPLLSAQGLIPVPLDFGNFGARQLIWPASRKKKRAWLLAEYQNECARLRCESPSIVAHSFGCYLVASLLKKYSQVTFDRVIFCGSIVHPAYPWAGFAARGQVKSVLNQYGGADFWAWIVQWGVEDAGPSGYSGFTQPEAALQQQSHPEFEHSDYFFDLNYNQNWIPFLLGKPLAATSPSAAPVPANWRFRFVLAVALLIVIAAASLSAMYLWSRFEKHPATAQTSASQPFSGFVQDDHGNPLPGVKITAPALNIPPQETDPNGRFSFKLNLSAGTNFRVIAQKTGFETYTAAPLPGDPALHITLRQVVISRNNDAKLARNSKDTNSRIRNENGGCLNDQMRKSQQAQLVSEQPVPSKGGPQQTTVAPLSPYRELERAIDKVNAVNANWQSGIFACYHVKSVIPSISASPAENDAKAAATDEPFRQCIIRLDERASQSTVTAISEAEKAHADAIIRMREPGPLALTPNQENDDRAAFHLIVGAAGNSVTDSGHPDQKRFQRLQSYLTGLLQKLGDYAETHAPHE